MSNDLTAGIVRILDSTGATTGTGFVVTDDGLIATCAHVVEATGAGPGDIVRIASCGHNDVEAEVLPNAYHPNIDVAFLRLSGPLLEECMPVTLAQSESLEGVPVRTFGYPAVGEVEGLWGTGELVGPVTEAGRSILQLRSTQITKGFSGSPVMGRSSGFVVGMVASVTVPDRLGRLPDVAFAIPAETLRDLCPEPLVLHPPEISYLPPLSVRPRTTRFQHDHALIGRDAELAWLWQLDGDGLLVGQPGSGKTFLLRRFALEGGGLFVVSDNRTDIAAFLSARHPNVVIVDDAQVRSELLGDLKHIRAEFGHSFHILATCWPGDEAALRNALVLPERRVCRLGLLTREEIVEVIKATGLAGPNEIIREIVNQAEGRPGLATTLAYLCLQGDVRRVLLGDVLSNAFLEAFEARIGETAREILAAFAVGGDVGMTLDAVAEQLGLTPLDVRKAVTDLEAGGVILETDPQHLSVRPPALRHVLIRDVFFCGPTALPLSVFQELLAKSPNRAQSVRALIGVKARGGEISSAWLAELVEDVGAARLWRLYVQLGREEATWVFENHPEVLTLTAPRGLEFAPDTALPLLLTRAIGDDRPLHAHTDHPLRIIQDWVQAGEPGSDQPLERRRMLLQGVRSWLEQGHDEVVGLHALRFVLSPNFQSHTPDPGSGNTITIRRGLLSPDELRAVQELWPRVLEILQTTQVTDWKPVRRMVEAWAYPGRFNVRVSSEASEVTKTFAVRLLRDLVPFIESHPGLCHWATRISGHLELDFRVPSDEVFETLYPLEDVQDVDQLRSARNEQTQAVRELAHQWRQRDPVRVVQDLAWIEGEARLAKIRGPSWTRLLCRELAEDTTQPDLWVQLMLDTGLSGDLIVPFLRQTIMATVPGWEDLVARCLDHPAFQSAAVSLILTHPAPPENLLSQVLAALEGYAEKVKIHCLRNEVSIAVLKRLLRHPDKATAAAAAVGEWKADPEESVREDVLEEWKEAVITDVREDFWLSEIFERRPSLAYPWLEARLDEGLPLFFTRNWEQAIQAAASALNTEDRIRLLHQLPDADMMAEAVVYIVGDDPSVYRELLSNERYKTLHLAPLSRSPEGIWIEMAKLALDAGYSSADIAAATRLSPIGVLVWSGSIPNKWKEWVQCFEHLCKHEDAQIREIGHEGRQQAAAMLDKALEHEHDEAVYGWLRTPGTYVVE